MSIMSSWGFAEIAEVLGAQIEAAGYGDLDWKAVDAKIRSEVTADCVTSFRCAISDLIGALARA